MSSTSTEQAIVSAKANVMIYDDLSKKWNPSGSGPGLSKVHIYQNLLNQTFRVVGRKVQDHEVVINCLLSKSIKYQANQTFLQWRDTKQVYGLHFQSKDDTDTFAQTMKTAVDNLMRVTSSSSSSSSSNNSGNGIIMNGNGGDNISLGKRSISSEYNNALIYDDNDRQNYNLINNMNGHHNTSGIYTGPNRSSQTQQTVTSPPLSNSSSSSSSTISSNGLTINTLSINGNQNLNNINNAANMNTQQINGYHNKQSFDYGYQVNNNSQIYNIQQQQQINTSSSSSSSTSSSNASNTQQPLYQSSPIPPPPPPPSVPLFQNSNGYNTQLNDNFSQKIYDVIPDNSNFASNVNSANNGNTPPPPPPMPTGLFSMAQSVSSNLGCGPAPPPPPPPPPPLPSMGAISQIQSQNSNSLQSANHASELNRSIAARQLKKSDDTSNNNTRQQPPQLDFLTEIRLKLEQKKTLANGTNETYSADDKLSNILQRNKLNPTRNSTNSNSTTSTNNNQFDSPKAIKKITSTPLVNGNGSNSTNNGSYSNSIAPINQYGLDNNSYDKLKQELISEFRKELQVIKSDIINSILNELRR